MRLDMRLHIGSGPVALPGWTNIDVVPYEGVHVVCDVRQGLPFKSVDLIFAEHFIEHLTLADGLRFLRACRRTLATDGTLRLSTPNLDWVWLTHYKPPAEMSLEEQLYGCLEMNRAFHGWGHRFLYNRRTLTSALRSAGFGIVIELAYGESENTALQNLEHHERNHDLPDAPSVLVLEASGYGNDDTELERVAEPYVRDAAVT
jgi:predicted SAM-dependent methyltransferase